LCTRFNIRSDLLFHNAKGICECKQPQEETAGHLSSSGWWIAICSNKQKEKGRPDRYRATETESEVCFIFFNDFYCLFYEFPNHIIRLPFPARRTHRKYKQHGRLHNHTSLTCDRRVHVLLLTKSLCIIYCKSWWPQKPKIIWPFWHGDGVTQLAQSDSDSLVNSWIVRHADIGSKLFT
jgi:hypothetical protein